MKSKGELLDPLLRRLFASGIHPEHLVLGCLLLELELFGLLDKHVGLVRRNNLRLSLLHIIVVVAYRLLLIR